VRVSLFRLVAPAGSVRRSMSNQNLTAMYSGLMAAMQAGTLVEVTDNNGRSASS
jgi:hypothetical protein